MRRGCSSAGVQKLSLQSDAAETFPRWPRQTCPSPAALVCGSGVQCLQAFCASVTYPFSRSVPGCYAVILSGMGTLTPTARGSGPQTSGSGGPLHEAVESPLPRHFQPWLCSGILRTRLLPAVPPHHLTLPSAGPRPACWSSLGPSSWF